MLQITPQMKALVRQRHFPKKPQDVAIAFRCQLQQDVRNRESVPVQLGVAVYCFYDSAKLEIGIDIVARPWL